MKKPSTFWRASLFRSRRVTDLTCCDLRELTLTPSLPLYITGALPQPPPLWPAISTYLPARPPLAAAAASSSCCAITRIQRAPPSLLPRAVVSPASQSVRAACHRLGFLLCSFPPKCGRLNPSAGICRAYAPSTLALERALWKDNRLSTLSGLYSSSTLWRKKRAVSRRISAVAECGMCPEDTSHGATRVLRSRTRHMPLGRGSAKRWG